MKPQIEIEAMLHISDSNSMCLNSTGIGLSLCLIWGNKVEEFFVSDFSFCRFFWAGAWERNKE
jgi:hypothetical protein